MAGLFLSAAAAGAILILAHYIYTLFHYRHSCLHSLPLPLIGHAHVLLRHLRRAKGDFARAYIGILEELPSQRGAS